MFVKMFLVVVLTVFVLSANYNVCIGSSTKRCQGNTNVLLFTNPKSYQIYHHFRITVKVFLYLVNLFECLLLKVLVFFMLLHNWQRSFPTTWFASAYLFNNTYLKFLLFLYPVIGISGNTFYDLHQKQGLHVILLTDFSDA